MRVLRTKDNKKGGKTYRCSERYVSGLFSNVSAPAALCQGFLFYCRSTVEQTYKLAARGPNAALEQPQSSPLSFYYWGN